MIPIMLGSVLVKLWLYLFNKKLGIQISSDALLATATDSRNDCIATLAVLLCALIEKFTGLGLDGYVHIGHLCIAALTHVGKAGRRGLLGRRREGCQHEGGNHQHS